MRYKNQIELRNCAIERLNSISWQAIEFGLLHSDILDMQKTVFESLAKTPQSIRDYVQGYNHAIRNSWWRHDLIWAHIAPDGARYTNDKNPPAWALPINPLYEQGRGAEIATWFHAHFWRGNGKPFAPPERFQPSIV